MKPTQATWRKGRDGDWLVFGPVSILHIPGVVKIWKKDSTFEYRHLFRFSKPFDVEGVACCYAHADEKRKCEFCQKYHSRYEVKGIYAGGNMGTGAFWRVGEKHCSCGGHLGEEAL